jgi:hypothetical protein
MSSINRAADVAAKLDALDTAVADIGQLNFDRLAAPAAATPKATPAASQPAPTSADTTQ